MPASQPRRPKPLRGRRASRRSTRSTCWVPQSGRRVTGDFSAMQSPTPCTTTTRRTTMSSSTAIRPLKVDRRRSDSQASAPSSPASTTTTSPLLSLGIRGILKACSSATEAMLPSTALMSRISIQIRAVGVDVHARGMRTYCTVMGLPRSANSWIFSLSQVHQRQTKIPSTYSQGAHVHTESRAVTYSFARLTASAEPDIQIVSHSYLISESHRSRPPPTQCSPVNSGYPSQVRCSMPPRCDHWPAATASRAVPTRHRCEANARTACRTSDCFPYMSFPGSATY